ncbi:hydrocephalus-inducing protein homolog [Apis florea]|uniref:hydrocephalus-inducing protein homolog n=1 Tax=Apis florea TaxID=7463 RepID=UPI0012FEF40F|nr:hydrocephalus-inducing protein homolog [Apis florea]XP_031774061.1 hydrocephalus-inducing protein homolog [Apis florea]
MSLEIPVVSLTGRGIEKSLNIIKSNIEFNPVIPFTVIQEIVFTIENTCHYPVEFFWHHLDENFQLEEDINKALLQYYNMKEILLPLKKPGDPIPWQLIKFYKEILNEMAQTLITDKMEEEDRFDEESLTFENNANEMNATKKNEKREYKSGKKRKKRRANQFAQGRKTSVRGSSRRRKKNEITSDLSTTDSERKNCPTFSIFDETLLNDVPLPTTDPEEIQRLLFCYIDNLHKNPDLRSKMKDPVKKLFESMEKKPEIDIPDLEKRLPEKRVCIIFHGAPFTEYQETACRSANALGIPVLDIDKGITEIIAFNKSTCAIQLRQIIDDVYQKYIEAFGKWKQRSEQESTEVESESSKKTSTKETSSRKKISRKEKSLGAKSSSKRNTSPISGPKEVSILQEAIIRLPSDPDPMTEFSKIPPSEKLELLEPLTRYEYKIQAILLLEKILDLHESPKVKGKSPRKREENVSFSFHDIDLELIAEVLQQRLASEDFKRGFVVQSLKSNFFQNNALEALLAILRIVGYIEYFLFVTFLNSMSCYDNKVEQRTKQIEKEMPDPKKRIREIDEMSASEYDQLSDEDKKMYMEAVLPRKKEEAARRRTRFMERIMERIKKKEVSKIKISKRISKRNTKMPKTIKEVSKNSKITSSKQETRSKVTRSRDSSKRRNISYNQV